MWGYPKNHGQLWTVKDMWWIIEMYHNGVDWNTIAQKLGRTVNACKFRVYIIKLAFALMKGNNEDTIMDSIIGNEQELTKSKTKHIIQ